MQLDENDFAKRHYKGEYRDMQDDYIRRTDAIQALLKVPPSNWSVERYINQLREVPAANVMPKIYGAEAFEVLNLISAAEYGKQRFFAEDNGMIFDRRYGEYLTLNDAIERFVKEVAD